MAIYLVRHGETGWNRAGLYQGTADIPLNADGEAQSRALAEALRPVALHAAYTSPLQRARATAEAVLEGRGVPLVASPRLREMSYGLWQGRTPAWRCRSALEWRWRRDPWAVRFPGGESLAELQERVVDEWGGIVAAHPGQNVLVSGHGHVNRVLLIHLLGLPRERFWEIEQPNGCCWRIEPDASPPTAVLL